MVSLVGMANERPKKATKQVGIIADPARVSRLKEGARLDRRAFGPWLLELGDARCDALGIPADFVTPEPPMIRPPAAAAAPKKKKRQ